jgi:hypothetical protein
MDTSKILSDLRAERDRIDRAIAALEALNSTAPQSKTATAPAQQATTGKRTMSASARRKISKAQKALWASKKAAQPRGTATQAAPKQVAAKQAKKAGLTAAGRKRLSENMKKRWAAKKKAAAAKA